MNKLILAVAIILSLSFTGAALAQTSNGTIAGTVVDTSGASVVKATVTILGVHTGATRSTVTNGAGGYRFDSVLLDTYTVTAEAQGFSKKNVTDVLVTGSVVTSVNPVLTPGNVNETVEIRAASELVQTDSGELSATIGSHALSNLPVSSLNPYQLAITLPGVSQPPAELQNTAGFPNGFAFSVNGSRPRSNNFLIEGQDNNDLDLHGQALQPENFEAYQDLTVLLNSYSAEFGHGAGSVSNLILKSGTNSFHGSVYERLKNSSLDAEDKGDLLNGSTINSKYRENLAGFSLGGPVLHNRAFFFVSYQLDHYRGTQNADSPIFIPTAAGIATLQNLSTNPRVAAYLRAVGGLTGDPTSVYATSYSLNETNSSGTPYSVQIGPYRRNLHVTTDSSELDIKGDYIISPKDTLQLHYIRSLSSTPLDPGSVMLPGFDTEQDGTSHNAGIAETHTFSPHLLNEFRFSYGRIGFSFNLASSTVANPLSRTPEINIGTAQGIYPGTTGEVTTFGFRPDFPQGRFHNTYQIQDTLTLNKGRHTIRAGADLPIVQVRDLLPFNTIGSLTYAATGKTISALANYVDDFAGDNGSISQSFGNPYARPTFYYQHYFVQDNWKAAENLTIELGFRYELSGTPFNSVKYVGVTENTANNYLAPVPQKADNSDWGPRFGFAWTPYSDKKTVLRGGFGIFYDGLFTNIIDNIQSSSPNAVSPDQISSPTVGPRGIPSLSTLFPTLNTTPGPMDLANYIDPNIVSPRTLQWNLNLEQELPGSFTWQVGYVGTRGEHLYATTEFNPYVNDYLSADRIFNNRGRIVREDNTGDSVYHALQTQVVRKYRNGLQIRAAYTWSHMEDDSSEIFTSGQFSTYGVRQYPNPRKLYDWSDSAYDHRHRFVVSYFYEIPKIPNTPHIVDSLVNGWSLAGVSEFQTGNPANVEIGGPIADWNGDGISNDRPMLGNPNAPVASYAVQGDDPFYGIGGPGMLCDGPSWYFTNNPCKQVSISQVHWILPWSGTPSGPNSGPLVKRNAFLLRGYQNWDVSAQKSFRTWHEQSLDFRAELFNIANHGNTGTPNLSLATGFADPTDPTTSTSFGDFAPTVTGHRAIDFFVRYRF